VKLKDLYKVIPHDYDHHYCLAMYDDDDNCHVLYEGLATLSAFAPYMEHEVEFISAWTIGKGIQSICLKEDTDA
jgi:hypothetical protein